MAIRLHQITSGRSGVSAGLASSLGAAVATGAVPDLHRFGSIGTGDLVPLAELGLTLVGERPWRSGGAPSRRVDDGDALPFMSSNALTLATAALVHRRLARLSDAAEKVDRAVGGWRCRRRCRPSTRGCTPAVPTRRSRASPGG